MPRRTVRQGLEAMRRQRSTGSINIRCDPRAWGLGPSRGGTVRGLLEPLKTTNAAPQPAAVRGLLRAQSEVALPVAKQTVPKGNTQGRIAQSIAIAEISGAGPYDRRVNLNVNGPSSVYGGGVAPSGGDIAPSGGGIVPAPIADPVPGTMATNSLDRVFSSVCSDIMNFNFKPYVRPVHWPMQSGGLGAGIVASGAPSRALRNKRR